MIAAIALVGVGLVVALGGAILLDRERFNHTPRNAYRLATVAGVAMTAAGILL